MKNKEFLLGRSGVAQLVACIKDKSQAKDQRFDQRRDRSPHCKKRLRARQS